MEEEGTAATGTITTTQQQQYSSEKTINFDDVPTELMHHIQSLLLDKSLKDAARTCVLSKSWLQAWSTFPDLYWFPTQYGETEETKNINNLVYRTVQTYHNNGVPIQALAFRFHVRDPVYTEFWFRLVLSSQTRSCLKELFLVIRNFTDSGFTFSDDILFSGDKLQTIYLEKPNGCMLINPGVNPVIKCVSLRQLVLKKVNVSEDVFHNLLSACSLLEIIILELCSGVNTIKVRNLGCLRHLDITTIEGDGLLEIDNVPSLGFFGYRMLSPCRGKNLLPFKTTDTMASSLGRSVICLHLSGTIIDDTFFDMIKSKFPFLETMTLGNMSWASERLVITILSLKSLTLHNMVYWKRLIDLQVYAPCLLSFEYGKNLPPTVLFPTISPKEIKLQARLTFNHMRLERFSHEPPLFPLNADDIVGDLREKVLFPVTNVQQLCPIIWDVGDLRERVLLPVTNVQPPCLEILDDPFSELKGVFDILFSICHPILVKVWDNKQRFPKPTVIRGMMEYKTTDLKFVMMKNPLSGRWEALTSSSETEFFIDSLPDTDDVEFELEFKFEWFSHD
uniref:uncharacterized protein LOC122597665 n=1 Tax=Erigeron canadensis TaxID=72917 RepID=UPI001CB98A72|nr:uncharacterized protein LOC122597665 [Erigeron canadensis]